MKVARISLLLTLFFSHAVSADWKTLNQCLIKINSNKKLVVTEKKLNYAKGFRIFSNHNEGLKIVAVKSPWQKSEQDYLYLILRRGESVIPPACDFSATVTAPAKRLIALSTTVLPTLDQLGMVNSLVGFSNLKYVNTKSVLRRVAQNRIKDVLYPPNPERALNLKPDLVLSYAAISPSLEGIDRLIKLKMPVVYNADHLESDPLARAEWVKFTAQFFDKENLGNSIFASIEKNYLELKKKVDLAIKIRSRPIVIVGSSSNGMWTASGGKSDFAKFIEDAGGTYVWKENQSKYPVNFSLEVVLKDFIRASIWLPQNRWTKLQDSINSSSFFNSLKVTHKKTVFNNNARTNKSGGNDYWERASTRPDILLADLVRIFHPDIAPSHELVWYQKLR